MPAPPPASAPQSVSLSPAIQDALSRAAAVLTPNQRISRALQQAHAQQVLADGLRGPRTAPEILPLDAWLTAQWQHLIVNGFDSRMLLNRVQEAALWTQVVSRSAAVNPLLRPAGLADLAARAWRMLQRYGPGIDLTGFAHTLDTQAFVNWTRDFTQQLRAGGYMTAAELPRRLLLAHAEGQLALPDAGLVLVDFDSLAPATDALLTSIGPVGLCGHAQLDTRRAGRCQKP